MNNYEDGGKLDKMLKSIEGLNQRMDIFDNKIEAINLRVTDLENYIQIRFQTFENSLKESASNMEIKMLKDRIKKIEGILEKTAKDSYLDEAFQRLFLLEDLEKERTEQVFMQESYDKRFNVLFHGLDEEVNSVWETRNKTLKILHQFMRDGLNITDPSDIALSDGHDKPFSSKAITIIDNFKKALGDTDNR